MKNLCMIAAIGKNNELGKDNKLIWNLPNDLKFFRTITIGKNIVMGSNTFFSLPKLLPNRKHIVLTSKNVDNKEIVVIHTREELVKYLERIQEEVFVIGGASIYEQLLEYTDKLYLTEIDAICNEADTYFPVIDYNDWDSEILGYNSDNGINYKHVLYKRKRN